MDQVLARLSRRTSSGRFIPEIDGLRFVAIALVVLLHVGQVLSPNLRLDRPFGTIDPSVRIPAILAPGWFGVELFFVISGFILALPFAAWRRAGARPVNLRGYYLRRLTRLEPPYVLALALSFAAAAALSPVRVLLPHLLASLIYQHRSVFGYDSNLNVPFWSLEIEVQFYLLVLLLAVLFRIDDTGRRRIAMAAVGLLAALVGSVVRWDTGTVLSYLVFFLAGFVLADVYVSDWAEQPVPRAAWDLITLVGWPVLFLLAGTTHSGRLTVIAPWLIVGLYMAAFRGPLTRRVLRNRWLTTIGGMCYSIYLLHYPLMLLIARALHPASALAWAGSAVALVAATLAAGVTFFALVERPCMEPHWPSKLIARLRTRAEGEPVRVPVTEPP
jgi:peptidoglycan/LPS O-acetylase OafA/YrhL